MVGGRLNYNITDWLAIGVWGAFGAVHMHDRPHRSHSRCDENTSLLHGPGGQNNDVANGNVSINNLLTRRASAAISRSSWASIDWIVSPQITVIPFRGKLAIFQKIFVDTDAYLFAGPAFVGLTEERKDCMRPTARPTFDRGCAHRDRADVRPRLRFYTGNFMSLGLEWRALPFAWNTGGFDTRGGAPDGRFPDSKVDEQDREFKFNQMLT